MPLDAALREALALHEAGQIEPAEQGYLDALRRDPGHPVALLYLGVLRQEQGKLDDAINLIRRSIELQPDEAAACNHLGIALLARGEPLAALVEFERALQLRPQYADALCNRGNACKALKRYDEAQAAYQQVLQADPAHAVAQFNLGLLYFVRREFPLAQRAFERTLKLDPRFHKAHFQLGLTAENLGAFSQAATHYQQALRIAPDHYPSLIALLSLLEYHPDETTLAKAAELAERGELPDPHRYTIAFGLAKRFDERGEFDRAFHHLQLANERRRQLTRYERDAVERRFTAIRKFYSREFIRRHARHGSTSQRPVFVLGMPRTGTTLTEQIIAAHPDVYAAGELPDIPRLVNRLPAVMTQALQRPVPEHPWCLEHLDGGLIRSMTAYYEHVLIRQHTTAARVVDKNPFNHLHVGLIALLFPRARIIHCQRDPLDVGLSCYKELFELRQDFTTGLADFGHYYCAYDELMTHWRAVLDTPMFELRYEDLVTDTERVTRELVEFCGLPWHDACLERRPNFRPVLTPSKWQVRQPIYGTSVGRWRHYAQHLEPLRQDLLAAGVPLEEWRANQSASRIAGA